MNILCKFHIFMDGYVTYALSLKFYLFQFYHKAV